MSPVGCPSFLKIILKNTEGENKIEIKQNNNINGTYNKQRSNQSKPNQIKMDSFMANASVAAEMMKIINGYRQEVIVKLAAKYGFDVKEAIAYLENKTVNDEESSAASSSEDDEPKPEKKARAPKAKKAKSVVSSA